MNMIVYDDAFNLNEWFDLLLLGVGLAVMLFLPRIFPLKKAVVFYLYGIYTGLLMDHTISVSPIDFYDVNDTSHFQFMDFLTYVMYGPFSYLFAYIHDRWEIKPSFDPLYVLSWAIFSFIMEWVSLKAGVFHYKNGYQIYYSFPIYLVMISIYLQFIYKVNRMLKRRA